MRQIGALFRLTLRFHFWGSLAIVLFAGAVIAGQIGDRHHFASSELYQDVIERWGAPIVQPVPSVRYVESGTVFSGLETLPLARQDVAIDATMNYRKRGLAYFSGFDFTFRGAYEVANGEGKTIDLVFVFPIQMSKNKVLLSDLELRVDGEPQPVDLAENADRLVWTGRLADGESLAVDIAFAGRGLDSFTYELDPALPVRDFHLAFTIAGGDHFDYEAGVVPASSIVEGGGRVTLDWQFASLESGVPVGVRLPSEESWDDVLVTMIVRSWAPFLLLFATVAALAAHSGRRLAVYESYLVAALYAFFFFLLSYLAAFVHFYLAYPLALAVIGGLLFSYLRKLLPESGPAHLLAALAAFLLVPTLAVILTGYTGLIYTLEILAGLVVLMVVTTRPVFRELVANLEISIEPQETGHAC
jgi:hypothetical protein